MAVACQKCLDKSQPHELYSVEQDGERFAWSVTAAKELIAKRETPKLITLDPATIGLFLVINQYDPIHLEHVDYTEPGIIAVNTDGRTALIDGTHRAAKAQREGKSFQCHIVWLLESIYCQGVARLVEQGVAPPKK